MLFTGDTSSGTEAAAWGLAVETPAAAELDERTEVLVARIARLPINQLAMVELALNSALLAQGVAASGMVGTVFDGMSRHTSEGYAFAEQPQRKGFGRRSAIATRRSGTRAGAGTKADPTYR